MRRHEPLDHLHEVLRVAVLPQLRHGDVGLEQPLGELVGSQLEQRATAKGGRGLLVEAGVRVTLTTLTRNKPSHKPQHEPSRKPSHKPQHKP